MVRQVTLPWQLGMMGLLIPHLRSKGKEKEGKGEWTLEGCLFTGCSLGLLAGTQRGRKGLFLVDLS